MVWQNSYVVLLVSSNFFPASEGQLSIFASGGWLGIGWHERCDWAKSLIIQHANLDLFVWTLLGSKQEMLNLLRLRPKLTQRYICHTLLVKVRHKVSLWRNRLHFLNKISIKVHEYRDRNNCSHVCKQPIPDMLSLRFGLIQWRYHIEKDIWPWNSGYKLGVHWLIAE